MTMELYTKEEFIKKFRPDGNGHVIMKDSKGKVVMDLPFKEVVCDSCNDELGTEENPYVYLIDGVNAWCRNCYMKYGSSDKDEI